MIFLPFYILVSFDRRCVGFFPWALCSIPLIHMSVFVPVIQFGLL